MGMQYNEKAHRLKSEASLLSEVAWHPRARNGVTS